MSGSLPPPPPAPGFPPPSGGRLPGALAAAPRPAGPRELDDQLTTIYQNSITERFIGPLMPGQDGGIVTFFKPINSFHAVKRGLMQNGVPAAGLAPVQFKMLQRLTTIIAQAAFGNGSSSTELFNNVVLRGHTHAGVMTIRQFMTLSAADQLATIDQAWLKVCTKKSYDKLTAWMYEPNATTVQQAGDPVPSGAIPDGAGGLRLGHANAAGRSDAFCGLGVGFRVDGSGPNAQGDIDRILRGGMTTQLKNGWLMRDIKGWEVEGTIVDLDTSAPRVWSTKNDLFNESAVCIARNLYGATAFPTREFTGPAVLWATDVHGLMGFDTEKYQTTLGAGRQWRPGEKAYLRIPPANIIAYVRFEKRGVPDATGGWKFHIDAAAHWTFVGSWGAISGATDVRVARVKDYVTKQLDAWKGTERTISGAYDFAT